MNYYVNVSAIQNRQITLYFDDQFFQILPKSQAKFLNTEQLVVKKIQ